MISDLSCRRMRPNCVERESYYTMASLSAIEVRKLGGISTIIGLLKITSQDGACRRNPIRDPM